jgi:hypothetical protein
MLRALWVPLPHPKGGQAGRGSDPAAGLFVEVRSSVSERFQVFNERYLLLFAQP